ncbi:acyl-CoA dehydrogenase [Kordiimonas sediminis]|uniref:Acyl-CoA dehydrogenase n=1 Tax=Kordiimonas sediminis TaxID=1735581 RepID=A0A919AK55_9PROT|nr:acyl-CoA dehydrogenase family protein [Kordiimonas sediminis]GHF13531.1 acyl-CoA dehydrogenase [Kordiimonas sediminis]
MADMTFLSWPFFEEHHRVLSAKLIDWCETDLTSFLATNDPHADLDGSCRTLLSMLGDAGFTRYAVPKAYGGIHETLDVRSLCLIRMTLAYYSGLADFMFAMQGLGSGTITLKASDAIKQRYLPGVAEGRLCAAFALTEPESGSDVAKTRMTADRTGDAFILNGSKTFISNGGIADQYVVFARTGEGDGARGLSAFVVDADTPGLRVTKRIDVIAPHPLATLEFSECRVPATNQLGEGGDGFKAAMATLDIFRSTVGAAALGFARRALDEATQRTRDRTLFDAPLHDLQLVQAMLGDSALDVDASALLIFRAAWAKDSGQPRVTREAAMAKLFATDQAQKVIDRSVQIFGGMGVVRGVKVEELYREIRALRIYEGASEVQKVVIARAHLDSSLPTGESGKS